MIEYYFGKIPCKIDFKDFLCLIYKNKKIYKSEFIEFSDFYEFIDKNIKHISHMLFDNYQYFLENGHLHNLYGPARIRINTEPNDYVKIGHKFQYFYINGKKVYDKLDVRGCKIKNDFEEHDIFFYEELTHKKTGRDPITGNLYRRKEGIDYIKTPINLDKMRENDIRKKKLQNINES